MASVSLICRKSYKCCQNACMVSENVLAHHFICLQMKLFPICFLLNIYLRWGGFFRLEIAMTVLEKDRDILAPGCG